MTMAELSKLQKGDCLVKFSPIVDDCSFVRMEEDHAVVEIRVKPEFLRMKEVSYETY